MNNRSKDILAKGLAEISDIEKEELSKRILYGMLLKKMREDNGISKEEMGLPLNILSLFECGASEPSSEILGDMIKVLFHHKK